MSFDDLMLFQQFAAKKKPAVAVTKKAAHVAKAAPVARERLVISAGSGRPARGRGGAGGGVKMGILRSEPAYELVRIIHSVSAMC